LALASKDRPTNQERLADFLHCTGIEELPSLLLVACGFRALDWSSPATGSFVSWEALSLWAGDRAFPQLRYEDRLMREFNHACDNRDIARAMRLCTEIEELLITQASGEITYGYDGEDQRKLSSQYAVGRKRLILLELRLWQLRHPEPPAGAPPR
jgi:hypothetical protein